MTKEGKRYLRRVRKCLPCARGQKGRLLSELRADLEAFLEAHPEADAQALELEFGSPRRIATGCLETMEAAELLCQLRFRRGIRGLAYICAALVLTSSIGVTVKEEITLYEEVNGYGVYSPTVTISAFQGRK